MRFIEEEMVSLDGVEFYRPIALALLEVYSLRPSSIIPDVNAGVPRRCSNCGRLFASEQDFYELTSALSGSHASEVCYLFVGKAKIFKYRNCPPPCSSTLVAVSGDRRDLSPEGLRRRELFDVVWQHLARTLSQVPAAKLHGVVLYLFRAMLNEGERPHDAYQLLKADMQARRFRGFRQESAMAVEDVSGTNVG